MTELPQARPEIGKVVDLSVQGRHHGAVLVVEGLVAVSDVDDRQPLGPDAHAVTQVDPARVRPPVLHDLAHTHEGLAVHGTVEIDLPSYPAHVESANGRARGGQGTCEASVARCAGFHARNPRWARTMGTAQAHRAG